jgi:hypothetical protein
MVSELKGLPRFQIKNITQEVIFGPSHEKEEISLFTTRWCRVQKLITPKYSPPKVNLKGIFVDYYIVPMLFELHKTKKNAFPV